MEGGKQKMVDPSTYDWDDTELISFYDEGMKVLKNRIRGNVKPSTSSSLRDNLAKGGQSPVKKSTLKWQVDDHCQALYPEDNLWYEAIIKAVNEDQTYLVEFIGYGNEEAVALSDLAPSKGAGARYEQIERAQKEWNVGDYCWALYHEDSQWYEGKIIKIVDDDTVTVKFLGYNNDEDIPTCNLKPSQRLVESKSRHKHHHRDSSIDNSEENCSLSSQCSSMTESCSSHMSGGDHKRLVPRSRRTTVETNESFVTPHVTPHPRNHHFTPRQHACSGPPNSYLPRCDPSFLPFAADDEDDTLSALLLSWYMAGYHTGYHMGTRSRSRH